jgi:hypothetical protein
VNAALVEAIIAGGLSLRQARVALALATHGPMGARKLEAVTGMDVAHCRRVLADLKAMGFPVDNPAGVWAESAHGGGPKEPTGVGRIGLQGGPNQPTPEKNIHSPEPLQDKASGEGWAESAHIPAPCSSGSSNTNTTTTTTTTARETRNGELIFPRCLSEGQKSAALKMLSPLNGHAQALLDELAGREAIQPIKNPLAYLRGLVRRAEAGDFNPEAGVAVAEARRRHEAMQQARKENEDAHLAQLQRSTPPGGSLKAMLEAAQRERPPG